MSPLFDFYLFMSLPFSAYKWSVYYAFPALLLFISYTWIVYPVFLSPLAKIPNAHWSSPCAASWVLWNRYQDREIQTVIQSFKENGPIVRLAPNEIAVNVIQGGINTVHNGGFHKSQWYDCFANYGVRNTFSSLGKDHAIRRRRVSGIYSKAYLHKSRHIQAIMSHTMQACLPKFHQSADTKVPIDFLSLSFAYSIDFMTAMIFGLPQATAFVHNIDKREEWLTLYSKSHPPDAAFWMQELPNLTNWLMRIGIPIISRSYQKAKEDLELWALGLVDAAEQDLREHPDEASMAVGDLPILYRHMKLALANEAELRKGQAKETDENLQSDSQKRLELASECLDHIVATRDTFGISMSYVLWQISRHPEAQMLIRKDLKSVLPKKARPKSQGKGGMAFMPSLKELDGLKYFNAVIKESLRLRNTTPTPNPRLTPENTTITLGTYDGIPGGVRISAFAWCLHREESVYSEAEEWDPERWMRANEDELTEMNKWFWAFGSGGRMCLGRNLALQLIQYTLAMIYIDFTTAVVDDRDFGRDGTFVNGKKSDQLLIQFKHDGLKYECPLGENSSY